MKNQKHFHFVFGLRDQTEPFHLAWYLCLKSCLEVNKPDKISLHYLNEPFGPWWEKIKPMLNLVQIDADFDFGLDESKYLDHAEGQFIKQHGYQYAHQADVVRLQVLLKEGGVYADIDTLFVRPYPEEYYDAECLLGKEATDEVHETSTLCNAVIMAKPQSRLVSAWLENMFEEFDGSWNRHSCLAAAKLSRAHPDWVRVVDKRHFFNFDCSSEGIADVFAKDVALPQDLYSIHLWSHIWWDESRTDFVRFHSGMLTEEFIQNFDTTYNLIARQFLD